MLDIIKALLGINDASKDKILRFLIDRCTEEAKNYTHREDVDALKHTIVEMVIFNFNRLGTEGVNSEDYSGVSLEYSNDYPNAIIKSLNSLRKVRVIR